MRDYKFIWIPSGLSKSVDGLRPLALTFFLLCWVLAQPLPGQTENQTTPRPEASSTEPLPKFEIEPAFSSETQAGESRKNSAQQQTTAPNFLKFIFWTGIVILGICACFYIVKRVITGHRYLFSSEAIIVLGKRALSPNTGIFLVQIGKRVLIVGVGKDNLSCMGEISEPDELAQLKAVCSRLKGDSLSATFGELLKSSVKETQDVSENGQMKFTELKGEINSIKEMLNSWQNQAKGF